MEISDVQVEFLRQYQLKKFGFDVFSRLHIKNRLKLFLILGGAKCANCGYEDIRSLQFDHIDGIGKLTGIGNKDRERFNGVRDRTLGTLKYSGYALMKYYAEHPDEARLKLQVLCANCHWIKTHYST
jgi:hypothetical protein